YKGGLIMKIGLASKEFINGNIEKNIDTMKKTMRESNNIDFILFPEAFVHGFDGITFNYNIDKNKALSINSLAIHKLRSYCNKLCLGLGFGYIELDKNNLYSSFMIIGKNGEIINNYRRISPGWKKENADSHYLEGENFQTFKLGDKNFVTAICGDLWYDENISKLHSLNYDYVLWPNYNSYHKNFWESTEKKDYATRAKIIGDNVFW